MDGVKTGLLYWVRDKFGGNLFTAQAASGVKVAGAADKAAIQRVKVPLCQLPDSGM